MIDVLAQRIRKSLPRGITASHETLGIVKQSLYARRVVDHVLCEVVFQEIVDPKIIKKWYDNKVAFEGPPDQQDPD